MFMMRRHFIILLWLRLTLTYTYPSSSVVSMPAALALAQALPKQQWPGIPALASICFRLCHESFAMPKYRIFPGGYSSNKTPPTYLLYRNVAYFTLQMDGWWLDRQTVVYLYPIFFWGVVHSDVSLIMFFLLTQFGNRIEFVVTAGRPANAVDAFVECVKGAGGAIDYLLG